MKKVRVYYYEVFNFHTHQIERAPCMMTKEDLAANKIPFEKILEETGIEIDESLLDRHRRYCPGANRNFPSQIKPIPPSEDSSDL